MGQHASVKGASAAQMSTTPPTRGHPVVNKVCGGRPSSRRDKRVPKGEETEGRTVKTTDARDGVSLKTPRGRQRETTSLFFPSYMENVVKKYLSKQRKRVCPATGQSRVRQGREQGLQGRQQAKSL